MPKTNTTVADDAKQPSLTSQPQISNTPTITSSGTLAWNVRDILFGPNRAGAGASELRSNVPKSSAEE